MKFPFFGRPSKPATAKAPEARAAGLAELYKNVNATGLSIFGPKSATGRLVTAETALEVPAIWAAVSFLARSMAALPLHHYARDETGARVRQKDSALSDILAVAPNDEMSSFDFRHSLYVSVFSQGRGFAFIETDGRGEVKNLHELDVEGMSLERREGRLFYTFKDGISRPKVYTPDEVIDIRFMPKGNGLQTISPFVAHKNTIALALAITEYGSKIFANGGVPPFAIEGPFKSAAGMERGAGDFLAAIQDAAQRNESAVALPEGHTIKQIAHDPEKMQMVDTQRFLIEQVARIYSIPPTFLQDLTHGTFSNAEQQDLGFAKHTLGHHVVQFEQHATMKLFGRRPRGNSISMNLDGLMRGDFNSRMEAIARAVGTATLTPNEARALEHRAPIDGGGQLYMQGAMVPLNNLGKTETPQDEI
jgi:HK97 family phage portal protein